MADSMPIFATYRTDSLLLLACVCMFLSPDTYGVRKRVGSSPKKKTKGSLGSGGPVFSPISFPIRTFSMLCILPSVQEFHPLGACAFVDCHHRYGITPNPKDRFFLYKIQQQILLLQDMRRSRKECRDFPGILSLSAIRTYQTRLDRFIDYSMMSTTTPEPTVLPPSRIAKRRFFSHAIGVISSTVIFTLSPGRHISTPSGN